ncbi:pantoate--beta-alanine ligase [bacterium]|nr:pantoate--beta-alanine ligase [bacterium]
MVFKTGCVGGDDNLVLFSPYIDEFDAVIVLSSIADLIDWRLQQSGVVVLVPTMGALHEGHLSLVRDAMAIHRATVIVSIFVNPGQFGPKEDFGKYPRTLEADLALLTREHVHAVVMPSERDLYPNGYGVATRVRVPRVGKRLCGKSRPLFFEGVCSVVLRLLNAARPAQLILGEKDFQQLQIVKIMCRDLQLSVEVKGGAIVREPDGLAMSSRNRYLSTEDRNTARQLFLALSKGVQATHVGERDARIIEGIVRGHLAALNEIVVDYVEVINSDIRRLKRVVPNSRLVVAVWLNGVRLIDNVPLLPTE